MLTSARQLTYAYTVRTVGEQEEMGPLVQWTQFSKPRRCNTEVGDKVRFPVSGVFLPGPGSVFDNLPEDTELEGTIIDFSDSGPKSRYFAVIEVLSTQSLIVPVQSLEVVETSPREGDF
jgi:hypothetical protein